MSADDYASVTITFRLPCAAGATAHNTVPAGVPAVGSIADTVRAAPPSGGHPKDGADSRLSPKVESEEAQPAKRGRGARDKRKASPKVVFDVPGGVKAWLEGKLSAGPATLDELADELSAHAKAEDGSALDGGRTVTAARRAVRMYGVNPRVSNISLEGDTLTLSSAVEE